MLWIKEVLMGKMDSKETEVIWSMNEGLVMMAEDYIRHDIYVMKTVSRFDPLLRKKFGVGGMKASSEMFLQMEDILYKNR